MYLSSHGRLWLSTLMPSKTRRIDLDQLYSGDIVQFGLVCHVHLKTARHTISFFLI